MGEKECTRFFLALLSHDRNVGAFDHENAVKTSVKIPYEYTPNAYISEKAIVSDENIKNL